MESKKKEQLIIKIFSLVAAFALWLYITNTENPVMTYKKVVPVTLINEDFLTQSRLKVVKDKDYTVTLTIRGMSTDIYMVGPDQFKVVADLGAYVMKKGENKKIPVEVKAYPENVKVVNSDNLWISIDIDDLIEKTAPVNLAGEISAKEGFHAFQPIISPNNVVVSGAARYINTVTAVVVKPEAKDLEKDYVAKLPLQAVDASGSVVSDISINPNYVDLSLSVKKLKTVGINLKTKGILTKGINLKSITPEKNSLDIASSDDLTKITSLDTEPIDLSNITQNTDYIEARLVVPSNVVLLNSNGAVRFKVEVDNDIQKTFNINIGYKNLNDAYAVSLDNNTAAIAVSGPNSVITGLKNEDFSSFIDLTNLTEGENMVNVNYALPPNVTKVSALPQTVKATIKKK